MHVKLNRVWHISGGKKILFSDIISIHLYNKIYNPNTDKKILNSKNILFSHTHTSHSEPVLLVRACAYMLEVMLQKNGAQQRLHTVYVHGDFHQSVQAFSQSHQIPSHQLGLFGTCQSWVTLQQGGSILLIPASFQMLLPPEQACEGVAMLAHSKSLSSSFDEWNAVAPPQAHRCKRGRDQCIMVNHRENKHQENIMLWSWGTRLLLH